MEKLTREERRLQKEQAKAAKAAARAPKEGRRKRRRRAAARVDEAGPGAFRPRLELVTEPGPVKHLHWDAERARQAAAGQAEPEAAAPRVEPPAAPAFPPPLEARGDAPRVAPLVGRRRTLYTTEHGNQVVAYERDGGRQLALTQQSGGRLLEVPFDEAQVDRAIGDGSTESAQETLVQEAPAEGGKPKRRGFWRRKAKEASTAPVAEHVYRPVELVDALPVAEVETAPLAQEQQVEAWEPGAALQAPAPKPPARPQATPAAVPARAPRRPRRRAAHKPARAYPGDNHPILAIEGIGPKYAKQLEKMRIGTTGLLSVARPGRIARRLKVPTKTVRKWQAQAELVKVRGIGPQFAEALARAGVHGIDELKARKPDDLAKQVATYLKGLDATVVGQPLTPKRIAAWKRKAKPMRRVKVNLEKLAVPDHGLPPPWLREGAGKPAKRAARKKAKRATRNPRGK